MWLLGIEYIKYIIYKIIGLPSSRHCWCSPTPSSSFLGLQETSVSSPYGCVRSVTGACQWNTSRRRDRTCRFSCFCSPPWHPVALRVGTKLWNGLKGFSRSACLHLFFLFPALLSVSPFLKLPESTRLFLTILSSFKWQLLSELSILTLEHFRCPSYVLLQAYTYFLLQLLTHFIESLLSFYISLLVMCLMRAEANVSLFIHVFNIYFHL